MKSENELLNNKSIRLIKYKAIYRLLNPKNYKIDKDIRFHKAREAILNCDAYWDNKEFEFMVFKDE